MSSVNHLLHNHDLLINVVGISDINIINPSNHNRPIIDHILRTVLAFNAQALFDKVHELNNFINSFHHIPDIISIVETWFNDSIPDQCLCLHLYSVYCFDRLSRGGGFLLLSNSDIVMLNVYQHMIDTIQIWYFITV